MSTLASPLSIAGTRQSGASVRTQNGKKSLLSTTAAAAEVAGATSTLSLCMSHKTNENVPEENFKKMSKHHKNCVCTNKMQLNNED